MNKALLSSRVTGFLKANGLLLLRPSPARLGEMLLALESMNKPLYDRASRMCAESRTKARKWECLHILAALHGIRLVQKVQVKNDSRNFYLSREWRAVRYKALCQSSGRCQCCGASPATGTVLHVDHIKPRSKFPALELDIENLQVLCVDCNMGKSNKDQTDWRPVLTVVAA